jgi:hypothetical protein
MAFDFNASVRNTLVTIVGTESSGFPTSSSWIEDPVRCRNRLYDSHPHARLEIGLIYLAHRAEVPTSLKNQKRTEESESLIPLIEVKQIAASLQKNNGLTEEAARWAVGTWADALEIRIPNRRRKFDSPSIISFEAATNPASASAQQKNAVDGTPVLLEWEVWGQHDQVKLTPPDVEVDPSGEKYIGVDKPTTFELHVQSEEETLHDSVTAGPRPPAIHDLGAEFESYAPGEKANIFWSTDHEDILRLQPGDQDVTGSGRGTVTVKDVDSMPVTLHASRGGGLQQKKSINLQTVQIRTFRCHSTDAPFKYALEWDVLNASRVTIDGKEMDGHQACLILPNASGEMTHTLTAYATSGGTCQVQIRLAPSRIHTFDADQTSGIAGDSITLTWQVEDAETVKLDDGIQVRDVTDREELEVRLLEGKTQLRLLAEGVMNRDVATLSVQGLTGNDVIRPVSVPSIPLHVSVNDVEPDLAEVRLPVASLGTDAISSEANNLRTIIHEKETSLDSALARHQGNLASYNRKVRAIKEGSHSMYQVGRSASAWHKIVSWVRREAKLFGVVPKATWRQVRSIVRHGISVFR